MGEKKGRRRLWFYILGFYTEIFWIMGGMWKQWAFYILSLIINSKSGLK